MKKRIGFLLLTLMILLYANMSGAETVSDAFGDQFRNEEMIEGFCVPVPAEESGFRFRYSDGHYMTCQSADGSALSRIYIDYYVFDPLKEFAENQDTAEAIYASQHYEGNQEYQVKKISVGGHIARICVFKGKNDTGYQSVGILHYARNNRMLQIRVYSESQNGASWEELPKVTLDDMKILSGMVSYDSSRASAVAEEGTFSLAVRDEINALAAGKTIRINAVFDYPDKVNKEKKNNTIRWTVRETETGHIPEDVSINQNGELSAAKNVAELKNVVVKAESAVYHTKAELPVTIIPAMTGLTPEPASIQVYCSEKAPVIVRAIPEPETVPPAGITWTAAQREIVEIIADQENGTAEIRPLKAGDTVITVKEPGGKTAKLKVNVLQPVEDIILDTEGKAIPGSMVRIRATIMPRKLWDKKVTWSLDVGDEIATIKGGTVKIAENAPAGTVITVICTAEDAPEPVIRTVQIEVGK